MELPAEQPPSQRLVQQSDPELVATRWGVRACIHDRSEPFYDTTPIPEQSLDLRLTYL
jgi:hypothetical protein